MPTIQAGDLKNGTTFEYDGNVFRVTEFQHVKPGKGPAFFRTKLRNVMTKALIEKTFNPAEKVETVEIEQKEMQYLYTDGDLYYLMDNNTYEQMGLTKEQMGDALEFIQENMNVTIVLYKGKVIEVLPPTFVELVVEYTEPGFSGNTATTSGKPARMENGLEISVPLFIEIGEKLKKEKLPEFCESNDCTKQSMEGFKVLLTELNKIISSD